MSGGKYIKEAAIAAICEHPDADKYRQKAFSDPAQVIEAMSHAQSLTKADFLAPDDDGKFIIDSAAAWKNFDKIVAILAANNEKLTYEDFTKPLGPSQKTLLESATAHGGLPKIFTFEMWRGRFEEMERTWYKVPMPFRKDIGNGGLVPTELKRALFAAEEWTTPEDRLAKSGLTPADLRTVFSSQDGFEKLNAHLLGSGDYLRKEYVLLRDAAGDALLDNKPGPWSKYDAIVKTMAEHGERLEIADYIKQVTYSKNILSRAAEHKALNKVFNPNHWVDRLPDMLGLWSHVLDGWKTAPMAPQDFDNAYAEAESATYIKRFKAVDAAGKADLLKPLNGPDEGAPVLALGLKPVWNSIDAVQAQLEKRGEQLTIADLRTATGQMGDTCLLSAAKFGRFDKVVNIARKTGEEITLADFMTKDCHGNTLLGVLGEKNQLASVFAPDIWVGRVNDMKAIWDNVPQAHRAQVDFEDVETSVRQATLRQAKGGIKLKKSLSSP